MREADRRELAAMGRTPKGALRLGLIGGWALTATVDGVPHAMLGLVVTSALSGEGCPWFLGSDGVYRHGREMVHWGPAIIGRMLDSSPRRLSNMVGSFNQPAIRLLRRWGFVIGEEVILSAAGVDFLPFSLEP